MLTVPQAGELKCRGPRQRTESNEMMPAQATSVDAHSELMRLENWLPGRTYQASGSSAGGTAGAFWFWLFQAAMGFLPGLVGEGLRLAPMGAEARVVSL